MKSFKQQLDREILIRLLTHAQKNSILIEVKHFLFLRICARITVFYERNKMVKIKNQRKNQFYLFIYTYLCLVELIYSCFYVINLQEINKYIV